ncbi:MAG: hypothetical protein Q4C52_06365 [Eubacteriales bacterium]|nr:hypothetical protein [Eubacteriales bacterium]
MNEVISRIDQMAGTGVAFMENMIVLIITIVIGLIIGLFGLKLARVWAAFVGFILGAAAGGGIAHVAGLTDMAFAGAMLGGAVLLAVLACIFYKVGIFFFILFIVAGLFMAVLQTDSLLFLGIGLAIGLVIAIITVKAFDPLVIIVTSIDGGLMAGSAIVSLIRLRDNMIVAVAVPLVLIAICACIQFIMRSRQVGKKQVEKAGKHRQQASRETEVEQARMLLDGDDYDEEDGFLDEDDYDEEEEFLDDDLEDSYFDGDDLEDDDDFQIIE